MKVAVSVASLVLSLAAFAAGKTYQVTGPVVNVTDSSIVVQKGSEKWEIARDPSTKVNGDLKVGAKVTVQYSMTAASIDVAAAGGKEAKKKK